MIMIHFIYLATTEEKIKMYKPLFEFFDSSYKLSNQNAIVLKLTYVILLSSEIKGLAKEFKLAGGF